MTHQAKEEEFPQEKDLPQVPSTPIVTKSVKHPPVPAPKKPGGDACQEHVTVNEGETLNGIAARFQLSWQALASSNQLADPNLLTVGQELCIPGHSSASKSASIAPASPKVSTPMPPAPVTQVGISNPFPYGQCTWWANERYHELHGVYVPWKMNANAWQWSARAADFGWQVSSTPQVGSIIDMQPGVQGAFDQGHVGVVEHVYDDGQVQVSSMNWGGATGAVTFATFMPGAGISFLHQ
jgi:surface antigen